MISDEKLRHYAVNFLKDEIAAIDKTLKNVRTEGEKIYCRIYNEIYVTT